MSSIGGKKREIKDFGTLKVGLCEASVIAVNPTIEEYKELLDIELKEDSKAADYLGTSKDDNAFIRVDFWLEEVKTKEKFKVNFFLEDKPRENKDGSKTQYINNVGTCSWTDDTTNLPTWFAQREYRVAYSGEEEFYNFMKTWLGGLDYRDGDTTLQIDWKKLMKGNVKEIKEQINGEFSTNVVALAMVVAKENKEGELKEYQGVYNKAFLPAYTLKHFRLIDFSDPDVLAKAAAKKPKDRKSFEKFALEVTDSEYGCKDFYILKDLKDYDPNENIVSSEKAISEKGADY